MSNIFGSYDEPPDCPGKKTKTRKTKQSAARLFAPINNGGTNPKTATPKPPCCCVFDPSHFYWAGMNLPLAEALKHLLIPGASGSGKTKTIQLYLQSILPLVRLDPDKPRQVIITDPKCDIVPYLAALGFRPEDSDVFLFNPFDTRSINWDISEALREPAMARYFAHQLIDEEKNSTAPYFGNAARRFTFAGIRGLDAASPNDPWTLRDLICALSSRESIEAVTNNDPRASEIAQSIFNDGNHSGGVISHLTTKLGRYEEVAALMATNPSAKTFSVQEFLKNPGVLILGSDPVLKESLNPLVALLLKALTDEILRQTDTLEPRQFLILDEFRDLGQLEQRQQ
jgi:type IV secretory pathway TraG/TraD family ATPase VirD4